MTKELLNDFIQWDINSWSKALRFWDEQIDWSKVENGLELGGREGGLSLWMALKGKKVVCSDLLDVRTTAEPLHIRHNVTELITYRDIDATSIPYENHFDIIVFKSIIGGIGRNDNREIQQQVFAEIHKALKPGGKLLFAENLKASGLHQQLRKRFVNWGSSWRYISIDELPQFLAPFSKHDVRATGFAGAFGRTETQRNLLSNCDTLLLNTFFPDRWKYISFGIAEK